MSENTSIGPADGPPDARRKTQATTEGVDAQNANAFDMQHGLAGQEAKPFSQPGEKKGQVGFSSQPANDRNRSEPNERSDMINERRNPGSHGGGGDTGRS